MTKRYLLVADRQMMDKLRLAGMFYRPFEKIPEIKKYLMLPKIDCTLIEASSTIPALAEQLRRHFPRQAFVLMAITEADGLLPQAAWDLINDCTTKPANASTSSLVVTP